jgi:hypothetical protein
MNRMGFSVRIRPILADITCIYTRGNGGYALLSAQESSFDVHGVGRCT